MSSSLLGLLVQDGFGAAPEVVTPAKAQENARFLATAWKDAVAAQLSEGWKAVEAKVPEQAKAIRVLSDTALEQSNAAVLMGIDKIASYLEKNLAAPSFAKEQGEAKAVLAEMKAALVDQQGKIDPASSRVFKVLDQLTGAAPIEAASAARKIVLERLRDEIVSNDVLRDLTDMYYRLNGTAKAVATLLLAGAAGAGWAAQNVRLANGVLEVGSVPGFQLRKTGTRFDIGSASFSPNELRSISGSIAQKLGTTGLSTTVAATYKKGDPLQASGGLVYKTYLPQDVRLSASTSVSTQFLPSTTALQARVEASKSLGRKGTTGLSAYAQAALPTTGKLEKEAGVQLTQRFGAVGRTPRKGNPAVVRRLTGPLPWLQRLFRPRRGAPAISQPYLAPPPPPPAPSFPWRTVLFGSLLTGVGWFGWRAWARSSS
jgi:hypothetical protein